jgi:DNA transformation protein
VAPDDIIDLFSAFGPVSVRRMFSGAGIYADGTMFALIARGVIYLKADAETVAAFERENLPPFTYATKDGKRGVMSYRRMPDRLYDDPEELAAWARDALAAARRAGMCKSGGAPKKKAKPTSATKPAGEKRLRPRRKRKSRAK